jgi:hypothetical protein
MSEKCCKLVRDGFASFPCGRKAKVERDGKHYCGIHDPAKREARTKAIRALLDAEAAEREAQQAAARIRDHKAECFDALVSEMMRYLPVIERAEADHEVWIKLTDGIGIATANGYRAALTKARLAP